MSIDYYTHPDFYNDGKLERAVADGECVRQYGECQCEACLLDAWYESQAEIQSRIAEELEEAR